MLLVVFLYVLGLVLIQSARHTQPLIIIELRSPAKPSTGLWAPPTWYCLSAFPWEINQVAHSWSRRWPGYSGLQTRDSRLTTHDSRLLYQDFFWLKLGIVRLCIGVEDLSFAARNTHYYIGFAGPA